MIDVLVKNTATEPTAILSVGDYVGGGTKLIAVPLSHVNLDGAKAMMAGATKQMLASMPAFQFKPSEGNGGRLKQPAQEPAGRLQPRRPRPAMSASRR